MNILSIKLLSNSFKSLKKFKEPICFSESPNKTFDPICLVGLNGSGKSHFMELIAECFMLSEFYIRNNKFPSIEKKPLFFEIEYSLNISDKPEYFKLSRTNKTRLIIYKKNKEDEYSEEKKIQYNFLPKRIIGYSSGFNETLSSPFLEIMYSYSTQLSNSANNKEKYKDIIDPVRMLYLDSGTNLLLVLTNLIYKQESNVINKFTNLKKLKSFDIEINKKIRIEVNTNNQIDNLIEDLENCSYKPKVSDNKLSYKYSYVVDDTLKEALKNIFGKPMNFFDSLSILNYLNTLAIPRKYMKWVRQKRKEGFIVKTPLIPDDDKFFKITNMIFETDDGVEIGYEGLSDGEHQLFQTLGALNLIDEPDTLFLFDEPATHYNPEWRSQLFSEYSKVCKERNQEIIVTTHSPYIVSSVRGNMVYHFKKGRDPLIEKPNFETYGCSINTILKRLFKETTLIPLLPYEEMRKLSEKELDEILESIDNYGESHAKSMLYKKINELEE